MSMLTGDPGATPPQPAARQSALRSILPYTTVLTVLVVLYVAWTMFSRYQAEKQAVRDAQQKAADAERERNADITQHGELTFTTFYASKGTLRRGDSAQLCYGVMNAASLKLDPPVEQVNPSALHCLEISPKKTTTYTITATGDRGQTKTSSLTVKVK